MVEVLARLQELEVEREALQAAFALASRGERVALVYRLVEVRQEIERGRSLVLQLHEPPLVRA